MHPVAIQAFRSMPLQPRFKAAVLQVADNILTGFKVYPQQATLHAQTLDAGDVWVQQGQSLKRVRANLPSVYALEHALGQHTKQASAFSPIQSIQRVLLDLVADSANEMPFKLTSQQYGGIQNYQPASQKRLGAWDITLQPNLERLPVTEDEVKLGDSMRQLRHILEQINSNHLLEPQNRQPNRFSTNVQLGSQSYRLTVSPTTDAQGVIISLFSPDQKEILLTMTPSYTQVANDTQPHAVRVYDSTPWTPRIQHERALIQAEIGRIQALLPQPKVVQVLQTV